MELYILTSVTPPLVLLEWQTLKLPHVPFMSYFISFLNKIAKIAEVGFEPTPSWCGKYSITIWAIMLIDEILQTK
jgi:hypothetical protein